MIFDSDKRTVQFFRVEYDVEKTQTSILKAGLPDDPRAAAALRDVT